MAEVKVRTRIQIWQDVIFAIFFRELKSQFNDKFGISWAIINPVIFIFVLSFFRSQISGTYTHSMPTFIFMLYGMLLIQLFLTTFGSVSNSIQKNKALFAFRQVQPISAVIANAVFELLVKLAVVVVLMLIVFLMQLESQIDNPLLIINCFFQVWLISLSLGLIFAIGKAYVKEVNNFQQLFVRPLFFISAVFFSLQDVPIDYWVYLNWNPLLHAIELSRDGAYSTFGAEGVSLTFLSVCTLSLTFFSFSLYHVTWKQVLSR